MALLQVADVQLNNKVRFRTLNPHDNILHIGTVINICTYDSAKYYSDVDAYYAEVKRMHPALDAKEKLTYWVLRYNDPTNESRTLDICIAREWIDTATLEAVAEELHFDIRVYDVTKETAEQIRQAVSAMGYVATVIEDTTP